MKMLERWTYHGRALAVLSEASEQVVLAPLPGQGHYIVNSITRILVKYATTPAKGPWAFEFKAAEKQALLADIDCGPTYLVLVCADVAIVAATGGEIVSVLEPALHPKRQSLRAVRTPGGVRILRAGGQRAIVLRTADFPRVIIEREA